MQATNLNKKKRKQHKVQYAALRLAVVCGTLYIDITEKKYFNTKPLHRRGGFYIFFLVFIFLHRIKHRTNHKIRQANKLSHTHTHSLGGIQLKHSTVLFCLRRSVVRASARYFRWRLNVTPIPRQSRN
jgi:hypothetical protein